MAKQNGQKLKLIHLLNILKESTDKDHGITMSEIISKLEKFDIPAERKSIYADIDRLIDIGYGTEKIKRDKNVFYHLTRPPQDLTLPELKILVDAVLASRFVSENKSRELINKLGKLTSRYQAKQLQRQVYHSDRVKTINDSGFKNIDKIYEAINRDRMISFTYLQWTIKKELEPRRSNKLYKLSPWTIAWVNDNYYLIAFDSAAQKIKHFRIDKMQNITILDLSCREGSDHFTQHDMSNYSERHFGMFGGRECHVKLECHNSLVGVLLDRFGKDIPIMKKDSEHFETTVKIFMSNQFIGWIVGLGDGIKVVGPDEIVAEMKQAVEHLRQTYL
ncbi:MAG: WYL domain-containing protein [Selenomonadaceae bacterium]|nr:WYL domain-containing protein [Selenomonadaceae bacterium]